MYKLKEKLFPDTRKQPFYRLICQYNYYAKMAERNHQFLKMSQKRAKI